MAEPVLQVERLTKRYQGATVVDGVELRIEPGETLCLLGPSGCGKSTILRMIAGIEVPNAGDIRIDGRLVASGNRLLVPSEKRDIGLVFQAYAIWPHMTVFQNVAYPLEVRRMAKDAIVSRVRETLAIVGLAGFETRPATQLSGGQQQRVALARALVYNPKLLLLDEPLSNLDARLRDELRNEIRRIQRQLSLTVLYVTHDQIEAMTLADRIAVMDRGRVVQLGLPSEVYDRPSNLFVQNFFGKTHVFDGTLLSVGGKPSIRLECGQTFAIPAVDLADGVRIKVSVRAEHIEIMPSGSSASAGHERVVAEVEEVRFLGGRLECVLKIGRERFYIEHLRAAPIVAGDTVTLVMERAHLHVWDRPS
jgi:ABC-type Fe3+/spermidine/putrescine transport system ATPase subunit